MIQLQVRITKTDRFRIDVDLLRREDTTMDETKLGEILEGTLAKLFIALGETSFEAIKGASIDIEALNSEASQKAKEEG